MKILQRIIFNKLFYLYFVPIVLFFFGLASAFYFIISYDTHFTVMPIVEKKNAVITVPQSLLVDGKIVKGEFIASENNLGSVGIRIKNLHEENVPDNYKLFFRIKQKNAKEWFSSNSYSAGQFRELDIFPFGFNLISDSKGKQYSFELYTKGANDKNALTVDPDQNIVGNYQLNKSDLKNPVFALQYLAGKLNYLFHNISAVLYSLSYFLPLYGYLYLIAERDVFVVPAFLSSILLLDFIRHTVVRPVVLLINSLLRFLRKHGVIDEYQPVKKVSLINILLFLAIITEIFFIEQTNNFLLFIILILWGISLAVYKIRLQSSFLFALGFLILCFLLFVARLDSFAEKAAIWAYLFLVIGTIHSFFILRNFKPTTKKA